MSGLSLEVMWTYMHLFGRLSEDAYMALSMVMIGALFTASVAGKFAKDK